MTSNDYVFTTDATGLEEAAGSRKLGVDAVKFVRRGATYLPYLNTTDNWQSTITARNDGGGPAQVYLSLFDNSGALVCSSLVEVPARAAQTFAVTSATCPLAKSARVDASQDMVVAAREEQGAELNEYNGILASGGSEGWERAGATIHVPLIKNARYGRSSKLYVMNTGQQPTSANIQFYQSDTGQIVGSLVSYPLGVSGSVRVRADACSGATNRCTARVSSSNAQPLAVAVLEQDDATTQGRITYTGFSAGARSNYVPLLKNNR